MCRSCPVVANDEWQIHSRAPTERLTDGTRTTPMNDHAHIVWYDDYDDERDRPRVGGKNASLGVLMAAGLPVPPGFAVTTEAYDTLRTHEDLRTCVNDELADVDVDDALALAKAATRIRDAIESIPVPDEVIVGVRASYEELSRRCGVDDVPVAVRSSATAEDLPDASFAGQQDTYLWIIGADAVVANVRRCWSSIFTDRAISYRRRKGFDDQAISMSVGVQKMVDPTASGVAFTLNPENGDKSQIAIDASWGLGEAVVSGEVTPDNYLVDKVLREVQRRIVSSKGIEYRLVDGAVEKVEIDGDRRDQPCLSDAQVCAVASLARTAERHYGCPQDVEWALDRHLPDGENIVLLQSRPETVWSNKTRGPIARSSTDPMASIVSTLTKPLKELT